MVPVPEIVDAVPDEVRPYVLMRWVDGTTFREIKQRGDTAEIAEAGRSMGETLARIGSFSFPRPGQIGPDLEIGAPLMDGTNITGRFVEQCLESTVLQSRLDAAQRNQVR